MKIPDLVNLLLLLPLTVLSTDVRAQLPSAHSHNDYEQPMPFRHAFDRGFRSIEADVWLVDGRLLVAHDRRDALPERTLAALYLDPLRAGSTGRVVGGRARRTGGCSC